MKKETKEKIKAELMSWLYYYAREIERDVERFIKEVENEPE